MQHLYDVFFVSGFFGSIPWNALSFLTMYFQYVGFSDFHAAVLAADMHATSLLNITLLLTEYLCC